MKNRRRTSVWMINSLLILLVTGCASSSSAITHPANATAKKPIPPLTKNNETSNQTEPTPSPGLSLQGVSKDWPTFGNNDWEDRFSPLTALSPQSATKLRPDWTVTLPGESGSNESFPLESHGILYVTAMDASVHAIRVSDGKLLWTYKPVLHLLDGIPTINRGVALGDGNVYVLTADDRLIALRESTGQPVFDVSVANEAKGYFESMAPLYAAGRVYVGSAGGDEGTRGFEAAYDAKTGSRLWQTYTIPARGSGWLSASGSHGGGAVWNIPAFDAATNSLFFGTGNPSPDYYGVTRPGANPMTDSVVSVDAASGSVHWFDQEVPHDLWDYDVASPPMLFPVDGQLAVGEAGKDGMWYEWNATTGESLTPPTAFVKVAHTPPTAAGVREWPGSEGGANYGPSAYDPLTGMAIIAGINGSQVVHAAPTSHSGYRVDDGTYAQSPPSGDWTGTITAIDVKTGKIQWQVATPTPPIGGVTVTAGGVVLYGQSNGALTAVDGKTGSTIWQTAVGGPIGSAPIVYETGGRTYVSVVVGGAASLAGLFPYQGSQEVKTFLLN